MCLESPRAGTVSLSLASLTPAPGQPRLAKHLRQESGAVGGGGGELFLSSPTVASPCGGAGARGGGGGRAAEAVTRFFLARSHRTTHVQRLALRQP